MNKTAFLYIFIFALLTGSSHGFAADVSARLDKDTVQVNEQVRLTIIVTDIQGNVQAPRVPAPAGMDLFYTGRASHLTFINNQSSSSIEFSYILVPHQSGRFTLQPIRVDAGGQAFDTEPISFTVQDGAAGKSPAAAPAPAYTPPQSSLPTQNQGSVQDEPAPVYDVNRDENIYILANVDKVEAYPNQQILLTYSLYTRYDTRYEGFEKEPEVSGFWIEEFPMEQDVKKEYVNVGGKRYLKADVKKMALFPTAPAEYTIRPGQIKASIRKDPQQSAVFDDFFNDSFFSGGSFFSRRENLLLNPPPIRIFVKPFPEEGKPKSFIGAVGSFRISSSIDRKSVKQDEPVTMKLIIEGDGNIETLNRPEVQDLKDFKVFESDASTQLYRRGDVIGGQKVFEVVFIPIKPGQLRIPPMEFSYFNPASKMYNTLRTQEYVLDVAKSEQAFVMPDKIAQKEEFKKDVEVQRRDIRYIHEVGEGAANASFLQSVNRWIIAMNALLLVVSAFILLNRRQEAVLNKNTALKRRRSARSTALARVKKLKTLKDPSEAAYFEAVERILTQYFADKFNLSQHGVTRFDLERNLAELLGEGDSLLSEIMNLYRWCDESRFAKAHISAEEKMKARTILESSLNRFEKIKI